MYQSKSTQPIRGFKRSPKPFTEYVAPELEKLFETHEYKRNPNKWRTMYMDDKLYFYIRKKKGLAKKRKLVGKPVGGYQPRKPKPSLKSKIEAMLSCFSLMLIFVAVASWYHINHGDGYPPLNPINPLEHGEIIISVPDTTEYKLVKPVQAEVIKAEVVKAEPVTDVEQIIAEVFKEKYHEAMECLQGENGGLRADATNWNNNGTFDRGIFQINSVHCRGRIGIPNLDECKEWLTNVENNVRTAYAIYQDRGWQAWYGCKQLW